MIKQKIFFISFFIFCCIFEIHAQEIKQSFGSLELQPTVAYLKYQEEERRMVRLLFKDGKSYSEAKAGVSFNGLTDSLVIPANKEGFDVYEVPLPGPPIEKDTQVTLTLQSGNQTYRARCIVAPSRKWDVYVLAHSHVDVGYTNVQPKVLKIHMDNIDESIALAQKTQSYPEEARYKWTTEAMWVVDNYLAQADEQKKKVFWNAVKNGWISLDAAYGNINTSVTDSRQLLQMFYEAIKLSKEQDIEINTMFQGDVPGASWGLSAQVEQTGIKYFLSGPNASDRIGNLPEWQDKPFYWLSPSGKQKLLYWQCQPYSIGYKIKGSKIPNFFTVEDPKPHYTGNPSENFLNPHLFNYLADLEQRGFPYDMTILTWAMSDNAPIDPELPDAVKAWNERYVSPRLIISSTKQFFRNFEKKYQDKIPTFTGDYTEYWTDGLGSAAKETALNRNVSDQLQQADAIWAIRNKTTYPVNEFENAWKNILLFSEHTWGAYNSVSEPEHPKVKEQWKIKQSFAMNAKGQTEKLMEEALQTTSAIENAIDVYNTTSWSRTDAVIVPARLSKAGDLVKDAQGKKVQSQRLNTGELAFVAEDVPPLGKSRYTIHAGKAFFRVGAKATPTSLTNGLYTIEVDRYTGAITKLEKHPSERNLVSFDSIGFNQYLYLPGDSLENLQTSSSPRITIKEKGPLVVSLLVESVAPGANALNQEIRLVRGLDKVEIINTIDKKAVRQKESVHFAFPFNVPGGQIRYSIPWGSVMAEADQLPHSNKNWYTVQRWVDISNADYGITWSSPDAPLFEIGKITTANLLGALYGSPLWLKFTPHSSRIYSWVMNNLWHTNFRADQEGIVSFRYFIKIHEAGYDSYQANQYGMENHRPLVVAQASDQPTDTLFFKLEGENVYVEGLKPANDGKGVIAQLVNCGERDSRVILIQKTKESLKVWESNLAEESKRPLEGNFTIPAKGMMILRVER